MNLHVKCPISSAKDDKDSESDILHSNDWMNSKGIAEDVKCGRFYLTLGSDACLWYESIASVGRGTICKDFSHTILQPGKNTRRAIPKKEILSV